MKKIDRKLVGHGRNGPEPARKLPTIQKTSRKKWTERELLRGVTPKMVGGEINWGPPVGKEIW